MRRTPRAPPITPLLLLLAAPGFAQDIVRHAGRYTVTADVTDAWPGGLIVARLRASRPIFAIAYANMDGRRFRFLCPPWPRR